MPPPKGTSNNPAGRPLGTPNLVTQQIRSAILRGCIETLNQLPELLRSLDTKERLDALAKLLRYVAPALRSVEVIPDMEPDKFANMTEEEMEARLAELVAKYNDRQDTDE